MLNKPIILLFSAAWGNKAIFKHQIALLENNYQVIEPDIHQFSTINDMSDMVAKEYASKNIAAIIGLSMGGYVVLDLLVKHPDFCRKAIILGSSSLPLTDEVKHFLRGMVAEIENGTAPSSYCSAYAQSMLLPENAANPAIQELLTAMLNELGPTRCANRHKACIEWEGHDQASLAKLKNLALLVIAGKEDKAVDYRETQLIAENIPNATFALIDDAAHFPMLEKPEQVNELITNFLKNEH